MSIDTRLISVVNYK